MRIVKIEIDTFGPLQNKSLEFGKLMSVIRGDNETGKSSLLLFIKFALYGTARKNRGSSVSEVDRAISRETERAAGSMTVEHEGKLYRIDRRLNRSGRSVIDKVSVTDTESGLPLSLTVSPGEYFLGIPVEVFESSCFISQLGASSIKGEEAGSALQNLLSNADENIDTKRILKLLEAARIGYLHKDSKGGSIFELEESKTNLEGRYAAAVEANCVTEQLNAEHAKLEEKIAEVLHKYHIADELYSKINLLSVIKLFDKLNEYKETRNESKALLSDTEEKIAKQGRIPDRAFAARLNTVREELSIHYNEYVSAKKNYQERIKNSESKKFPDELDAKISAMGGFDGIQSKFKKISSRSKLTVAMSVIFGMIFTLCAALGALSLASLVKLPFTTVLFCAAALSAILFVISMLSRKKNKRALCELCALFDTDAASFSKTILELSDEKLASEELKSSLKIERSELTFKERLLVEKVKNAFAAAAPFFSVKAETADEVLNKLDATINEVSEFCQTREELSNRISLLDDKIKELSADLSDYNEHQIRGKISPDIFAMTDAEIQNAKKEKNYYDLQLKALGEKKLSVERALLERKYSAESPFEISAKLGALCEELESQKEKHRALCMAIDAINTASANMRNTLAPKIRALSNEYMSRVTDGKYDSIGISDSLELSMSDKGFSYPAEAFSTGTKDIAYLTMRLSLLKLLPCDELPPMLMDESLAMIDDKRAGRMLSILAEHCEDGGQCIIFTCHGREEGLLENAGIKYSSIVM